MNYEVITLVVRIVVSPIVLRHVGIHIISLTFRLISV